MNTRTQTNRRRNRARSGITLLEVMITTALLSVVIGSLVMMARANDRAYRTGAMASDLESRSTRITTRLVDELRVAVFESLVPDPGLGGVAQIEYLIATGMTAGEVDQSGLRRLGFEYEIGELDDGLDNNGNGLIDEGRLILTENVGDTNDRRVITRWVAEHLEGELADGLDNNGNGLVDEPGFLVERTGESLIVRVTLQKTNAEGRLMTRTARTSVRLRN